MEECKYCTGDVEGRKALLGDDFNNVIYISGNNTLVGDDDLELDEIKINYCPICGNKLVHNTKMVRRKDEKHG